ncbi:hypothetical protein DOTSEDRAFT_67517 [Dothistroma septosporum NZE10]|uniref:Uncharacterized protein n=1 Tax=Dothistroma septosporum (strain NZE10 / CBS 128990) TaxID=675120 RepID=N1PYA5_DOTSN|nr:hypothetical protein DOTSEDRAFT_67517 [Dothistroma septosporum NZE10]
MMLDVYTVEVEDKTRQHRKIDRQHSKSVRQHVLARSRHRHQTWRATSIIILINIINRLEASSECAWACGLVG